MSGSDELFRRQRLSDILFGAAKYKLEGEGITINQQSRLDREKFERYMFDSPTPPRYPMIDQEHVVDFLSYIAPRIAPEYQESVVSADPSFVQEMLVAIGKYRTAYFERHGQVPNDESMYEEFRTSEYAQLLDIFMRHRLS